MGISILEQKMRLEMRLSAIEFLLCKLTASILVAGGKSGAELKVWRSELIADFDFSHR